MRQSVCRMLAQVVLLMRHKLLLVLIGVLPPHLLLVQVWLDQADSQGLSEGEEVTFMDWGNAFIRVGRTCFWGGEGGVACVRALRCTCGLAGELASCRIVAIWAVISRCSHVAMPIGSGTADLAQLGVFGVPKAGFVVQWPLSGRIVALEAHWCRLAEHPALWTQHVAARLAVCSLCPLMTALHLSVKRPALCWQR